MQRKSTHVPALQQDKSTQGMTRGQSYISAKAIDTCPENYMRPPVQHLFQVKPYCRISAGNLEFNKVPALVALSTDGHCSRARRPKG